MAYESDVDAIIKGGRDGAQIGKIAAQAIAWLFFIISRPAVLVTLVYLRKDLGERYFTVIQAVLGLLLIMLATGATVDFLRAPQSRILNYTSNPYINNYYRNNYYNAYPQYSPYGPPPEAPSSTGRIDFALFVGGFWEISFALLAAKHFLITLRQRQKNGVLWHSRSDGTPRFKFLGEVILLVLLAIFTYWTRLYGICALLSLSLFITFMADAHARKELYNRVLDVIDGQIESEWLGNAIERKLNPGQAHGLNAALPARVSNQYRRSVTKYFKERTPAAVPIPATASLAARTSIASNGPQVPAPAAIPPSAAASVAPTPLAAPPAPASAPVAASPPIAAAATVSNTSARGSTDDSIQSSAPAAISESLSNLVQHLAKKYPDSFGPDAVPNIRTVFPGAFPTPASAPAPAATPALAPTPAMTSPISNGSKKSPPTKRTKRKPDVPSE